MKIAVRRRLAAGAVVTSATLVAGLLLVPTAGAAAEGLRIDPSGVENTQTAVTLTFTSTEADQRDGAVVTFNRKGTATFTVDVPAAPPPGEATSGTVANIDFTKVSSEGTEAGPEDADSYRACQTSVGTWPCGADVGPADAGTYQVTIVGNPAAVPAPGAGGGTDTCASCFTVLPATGALEVTSISPTSLRPGQTGYGVVLAGRSFERGSIVELLIGDTVDPNIEIVRVAGTTATELLRNFIVAGTAVAGARTVRVRNLDGRNAVCTDCFAVAGQALSAVDPSSEANDPGQAKTSITFSGAAVTDGQLSLEFTGTPGFASRGSLAIPGTRTAYSATSATAEFDLADAAPGPYQPVVRNASTGVVNGCDCRFTVVQRAERSPTLTTVDRFGAASGKTQRQNRSRIFDITGTNFSRGLGLTVAGTGVTVAELEFVSATMLRATLETAADATTSDRDVTVKLTDGKTSPACTGCYTVTAEAPAQPFAFTRFEGADRYATAAAIATGSYPTAPVALLANGQSDDPSTSANEAHFQDALAGAYLAGNQAAPTLLTTVDVLPQVTLDALTALKTETVIILGGTAAVSAGQQTQLTQAGFTTSRIGGASGYDTARLIAETPPSTYVGVNPDGERTAFVASGEGFADALVAGPLAYRSKFPVLLTTPGRLSEQARASLQKLEIDRVLIPGGTVAVSAATVREIEALGIVVQRFDGQNRNETAVKVADYAYDVLGYDSEHVNLAGGDDFPDALAGGAHAGLDAAPILLTATSDVVSESTLGFLTARKAELLAGHVLGGTSAISQSAQDQAEAAVS